MATVSASSRITQKRSSGIAKLLNRGDAKGQHNLGYCYANGLGVKQNHAEAVKWYRKAAEQGWAYSQFNLGNCYYMGKGVKQDYTEAVKVDS
ncbi:MAG: sel1 repeat family protein [Lentisphaeria bacterium]|nr:MAG: sel1 repeat family protein [Lentisphaeria bacterium]